MSINIYEDSLYWLMGGTGIIRKCKLYGDKLCTTIPIGTSNINKYFIILHTIRQPIGKLNNYLRYFISLNFIF